MDEIIKQLDHYKAEIDGTSINTVDELETFRIRFLGAKGIVKNLMASMKDVPAESRKSFGLLLNAFKQQAEEKYASFKPVDDKKDSNINGVDVTLPGTTIAAGSRHPITLMRNRIVSIFQRLGFAVAEGPEIEDDWHNFTALNLDENHPARDMQDTFYLSTNPDWLLRTHTSNVQIREMEKNKPPIRIICPGRVYRNETVSARSHCFFHQVEGLYIAENVSFADLKQTLYFFCKRDVW